MKALVFFDAWCADSGIFPPDDEETGWVALDPRAMNHLIQRGIPKQRIQSEVGWITTERREHLVRCSDDSLQWLRKQARFPELEDLEWSLSELLLWYAYWVVNYCLWVLELNSVFSDFYKPEVLRAGNPSRISHDNAFITEQDGLLANLTASFARNRNIRFEPIEYNRTNGGKPDRWLSPAISGRINKLIQFIRSRYNGAKQLRSVKAFAASRTDLILATTLTYRMGTLIEYLRNKGCNTTAFLLDDEPVKPFDGSFRMSEISACLPREVEGWRYIKERMNTLSTAVEGDPDFFSHSGVSYGKPLASKLQEGIGPWMFRVLHRASSTEEIVRNVKPNVVVAAGDLDDDRFTGAICRRWNVPGIMISHGSHVVPKSEAEHIEWGTHTIGKMRSSFQFQALQSPLAEAHRMVFPSDGTSIRTGPLLWGSAIDPGLAQALRRELLGNWDGRVILHAGTPKGGRSTRFYIYETPNEYVQGIVDLAEAVKALSEVRLIVKFRPSKHISIEDLKSQVEFSDRVILSVDEPFLDVLGFSNLMVSFSSTTIEEALANCIPVVFYGGDGRYQHVEAPVYRPGEALPVSPVYAIKDSTHLSAGLENVLALTKELTSEAFRPFRFSPEQIDPIEDFLGQFLNGETSTPETVGAENASSL